MCVTKKVCLVMLILSAGWAMVFWLQQALPLSATLHYIAVPVLLVLILLLAALAVDRGNMS